MTDTPTPVTDTAVSQSASLTGLVAAAEDDPTVMSALQKQFDSYSHNPLIAGITSIAGVMLTRQHITVDNTVLTVAVGIAVTVAGYLYQMISMKLNKPKVTK